MKKWVEKCGKSVVVPHKSVAATKVWRAALTQAFFFACFFRLT